MTSDLKPAARVETVLIANENVGSSTLLKHKKRLIRRGHHQVKYPLIYQQPMHNPPQHFAVKPEPNTLMSVKPILAVKFLCYLAMVLSSTPLRLK